jgi:hypothetical protein
MTRSYEPGGRIGWHIGMGLGGPPARGTGRGRAGTVGQDPWVVNAIVEAAPALRVPPKRTLGVADIP